MRAVVGERRRGHGVEVAGPALHCGKRISRSTTAAFIDKAEHRRPSVMGGDHGCRVLDKLVIRPLTQVGELFRILERKSSDPLRLRCRGLSRQ